MPTITDMQPTRRDPNRVAVSLDGEFAFAVSLEAAARAGLSIGEDISSDEVDRLQADDDTEKATQAGLRFLGPRSRSVAELRRRLRQRGFTEAAIEQAVQNLSDWGYLDDGAFAVAWAASRRQHRPRSARLVAQELRLKGVAPDAVDLSAWDDQAAAHDAASQWLRSRGGYQPEQARRLALYLQRRGFGGAVIRSVLRALAETSEPA